ncbi:MAG: glucose-6-phosphate isomerase, partial [Propionibacteriaceae bacterium]|nr:glucose-6-phosphate isomerase [Propionibacteriaceae bacterium]
MDSLDPTATTAWAALSQLAQDFTPDLRRWFDQDRERAVKLTFQAGDLRVDLSKNLITDEVLASLLDLAQAVDLAG